MKLAVFNNIAVHLVATMSWLCITGCGSQKVDLLAEVNKRFPVQSGKIEVKSMWIKSKSIPSEKAAIATGETAVVLKEEEITILAEVSEREWGFANMMQVWDEILPTGNLPQQPNVLGNSEPYESHPAMNFGAFLRGESDAKVLLNEKLRIGLFRFVSDQQSPTSRRGLTKITMTAPKLPGVYVLDLFIVNGSVTKEDAPRLGLIPFHRIPLEVR